MKSLRVRAAIVAISLLAAACGSSDGDADTTTAVPTTRSETTTSGLVDTADTAEPSSPGGPTGLTEADLVERVAAGWGFIWDGAFDRLTPLFTLECRSQITAADYDATFGQGLIFLEEAGVDVDAIEVDVRVEDFVDGESADTISTINFPGDEPDEQSPVLWIVEDGAWVRADCSELAGVAARGTGGPVVSRDVGSSDNPAGIGGVFAFDGWRGGIIQVEDAVEAGWIADSDSPPAGSTWVAVVYEAQHLGTELGATEPFIVYADGNAEYNSFDNDCFLDPTVLADRGIQTIAKAIPGEIVLASVCLEIPEDEVEGITYVLSNAFSIDSDVRYVVGGAEIDPLEPAEVPDLDITAGAIPFGEVHEFDDQWTATVVTVVDGVAEGLISEFAGPPPAGSTHAVVIYEATYSGSDADTLDPFLAEAFGSGVYTTINSLCFVDTVVANEAYGVSLEFEVPAGHTYRETSCVTVPVTELGDLVVSLDNVFSATSEAQLFAP
ncbi:MAG: hypothetical protein ACR2P0_04620 [Acidimicrobiales bacterium]